MGNCVEENFDDVVAVKPSNHGSMFSDCSQDILVRNFTITHGVGLSIGSVPPNTGVNCIRNITLEDSTFSNPFKALYVKPNPGNVGSGLSSSTSPTRPEPGAPSSTPSTPSAPRSRSSP